MRGKETGETMKDFAGTSSLATRPLAPAGAGTLKCPPDPVLVGDICIDLYEGERVADSALEHLASEEGAGRQSVHVRGVQNGKEIVMKSASTAALMVLALCLIGGNAFADATTSAGTNAVYVSRLGASINQFGSFNINAISSRGKSRAVLEIDVTVNDETGSQSALTALATVNGVNAEPSSGGYAVADCNSGFFCSLASQWWIDLDAAEAAHPGCSRDSRSTSRLISVREHP
jgi:hypothetical protein